MTELTDRLNTARQLALGGLMALHAGQLDGVRTALDLIAAETDLDPAESPAETRRRVEQEQAGSYADLLEAIWTTNPATVDLDEVFERR